MKWFKHDSDASNDAKLRKLRHKYGTDGYAVYWYCLELVARNVDKHNLTFELEHDAELIADDFKLSSELVEEMMTYMVNLRLFENTQGVITCLKMATRTDEYTQKLINKSGVVPTLSRQSPTKSVLIEEKRREETDTSSGKPECMGKDWTPNETNIKWMMDSGLSESEQKTIIRDFVDFWILSKTKRKNWDLTFRRNPIVNRKINTKPNKTNGGSYDGYGETI